MKYKLYGLIVETELNLLSVGPIVDDDENTLEAEVIIVPGTLLDVAEEAKAFIEEQGRVNAEGEPLWLIERLGRVESHITLINAGKFKVTGGRRIEYCKNDNADEVFFEQSILIFCMGILLIQRERIVLHGSGLLHKGKLIVISGESGSGKSTLTNELLKHDFQFMADDAVALEVTEEEVYGFGTFPIRRLCSDVIIDYDCSKDNIIYMPDGGKDKYGIDMKEYYYDQKTKLGAIFIIEPKDIKEVQVQKVEGVACIKYVTDHLFKKASYQAIGLTSGMMSQCLTIAKNIPIYIIKRPLVGMTVKEQVKFIEECDW